LNPADVVRSLIKPTLSGGAVRAAGVAFSFGVGLFVARTLGPEQLGAYQATLSVSIILAAIGIAGTAQPSMRRIAALTDGEGMGISREVALAHVQTGVALLVIEVALLSGAAFAGASDATQSLLLHVAMLIPGLALLSLRQWIALPVQGTAGSLAPEQIGLPVVFALLVLLVAGPAGLAASEALVMYALACGLVWLVTAWQSGLLALLFRGLQPGPAVADLPARFRVGRPFVILALVDMLSTYTVVPLVAGLLNLESAGQLAMATQFAMLVGLPLQVISLTIMSQCIQLHRDHDVGGLESLVRTAATLSFGLSAVLAIGLYLFFDVVLGVVGPGFGQSGQLLPILIVGQLINAVTGPNGPTLWVVGRESDVVRVQSVAAILHLGAVAGAAYSGSVVGVAVAVVAASAIRNVLMSLVLYRRVGVVLLPYVPFRRAARR
jgi:O-antigen/teichoic acid export membrane protein